MPRPKTDNPRHHIIKLRLTEREMAEIKRAASDKTTARFARETILRAIRVELDEE